MSEELERIGVGRGEVVVALGDLTLEACDAIVNAANSALTHGGGVAGAIVRRGGEEIQRESTAMAPVPVGGAVFTRAGRLPCRSVIHAVGPVWGEGDEERKLRRAVRSALAVAEELGVVVLALPAISTGIFGFPKALGCRTIAEEVVSHLRAPSGSVREVRLVSLDRDTASHFSAGLRGLC